MIATVKIIPFSTQGATLKASLAALGDASAVAVAPFRPLRIAVVSTLLPGLKTSVVAKTLRVARGAPRADRGQRGRARDGAARDRPACRRAGAARRRARRVIIFGASAITDRRDVIPAAIEAFGGRIERFGMPVDPGNLLLLATRGETAILGAPGCARSPKENGFDWVLQRLIAGVPTSRPRHPRHGRRRPPDGDRLPPAAARSQ